MPKCRLALALLVSTALFAYRPAVAAQPAVGGGTVGLLVDKAGRPVLTITYPWQVHRESSVEVAMLPQNPALVPHLRPSAFRSRILHGEVVETLYQCESGALEVPVRATFTVKGTDFEAFGRRNSLGAPTATVAWRDTLETAQDRAEQELAEAKAVAAARDESAPPAAANQANPPAGPAPAKAPAAGSAAVSAAAAAAQAHRASVPHTAFTPLDPWALDRQTLYLDLPEEYFAAPGKLRVWFMRGEDVVWAETINWPGYPQNAARVGPPATPPAISPAARGAAP